MKKIVLFILAVLMSIHCFAQRDIKTFEDMSPEDVKALYGTPLVDDDSFDNYSAYVIFYEHFKFYYCELENAQGQMYYHMADFETDSPLFCVLSDYIEGGIKVGDPLSRLQSIDFQHCPYGLNKSGNALKVSTLPYPIFGHPTNYVAFDEQYLSLFFAVEDGVITAFSLLSKEDDPNPNDPWVPIW